MKKQGHFRRIAAALLTIIIISTLCSPALAVQNGTDDGIDLKIAVMSDTHYLSPNMIKDTADYTTALNSDRKMLTESSQINLKLLDAVREDKPDILLVSGDLTKDGELEDHREFSARLQQLQKDIPGMKVYVINGNHDVRNANAKDFNTPDGKAVPAARTEPKDFVDAYSFVYSDSSIVARYAPPQGKESGQLSYVAEPCEGVTLIVLDTCCYSADNTSDKENEHDTRSIWCSSAVGWAAANGIVNGFDKDTFAPNATVTREQMAAILYRYAAFKGIGVSAAVDLGSFSDFDSVSVYARSAMAWAAAEGIINGTTDGRLMPDGGATRAQVAAILHRYIENCIF